MHFRIPSEADLGSVMPGVLERFRAALADLEALGATIEERPMPEPPEAYMVHAGDIMAAEAWHHLGRYVDIPDSVVAPAIRARILKGKEIELNQGDVVVLPAGTGHQCLWASPDLLVIGTYPKSGRYDLCRGSKAERQAALQAIPEVPLPETDPVFGKSGPLMRLWQA